MYKSGDEINGSIVVCKSAQGKYILRCECQCTFEIHVNKILEISLNKSIVLRCWSCNAIHPREPRTPQPYNCIGKTSSKKKPSDRVLLAFRLRYHEKWTYAEIAKALSVSVQTVHVYFARWGGRIEEYKGLDNANEN